MCILLSDFEYHTINLHTHRVLLCMKSITVHLCLPVTVLRIYTEYQNIFYINLPINSIFMFQMPDNHLHFDMCTSGIHPELFIGRVGVGGEDPEAKHNLCLILKPVL